MKRNEKFDAVISHHGTVVLIRPLTRKASRWLAENAQAESWQWFGEALACEPQMVTAIADAMAAEGFSVDA